jgi:hypothetical protein
MQEMVEKATTLELEGASIVILGSFNPVIFHPSWLLANGLISKDDSEDTEVKQIHPAISSMFVGKWLNLEVMRERFSVICSEPPSFQRMRDLVLGVLSLLEHTPVTAIGMNFDRKFSLRSEEALHKVFDRFCPASCWKGIIESPAFKSFEVSRGRTKERLLNLKIAFEHKVEFGLFVSSNYHREPEDLTPAGVVDILNREWKDNFREFKGISEKILGE